MKAKRYPTSQGVSLDVHSKKHRKHRSIALGVDDHGNFYIRLWRQHATSAEECRVYRPHPLLKTAASSVLLGTLQPAVLADYLDEHRSEWDATRDETLWERITTFLRKWQRVYDRRVPK